LIRLERMGAVVVGLSLTDIVELYDVRFLIESFVQQRLAKMDRDQLLVTLRRIVDRMELAVKHQDAVEFSIRPIVMTVMLITTEEIFSKGEAKLGSVIGKHQKIMDGLASGDEDEIQKLVQEYFADSRQTLHRSLTDF
ncbi:hypothetical protein BGX30_011798, partial [Mortierella sp. GBA39]